MTARRFAAGFGLVFVFALSANADDPSGDPIPAGAKLRLGTARMRSATTGPLTAITPDGKLLVGSGSGEIRFVDPTTGRAVRVVKAFGDPGQAVLLSADGKRGVGMAFQRVVVWDAETGATVSEAPRAGPFGDNGVAISADGKRLAVGGARSFGEKDKGPEPFVWDVDGRKQLAAIQAAQNDTVFVALSPDGKRLATWGYHLDRKATEPPAPETDPARLIQFWDPETGKETGKARLPTGFTPGALTFSPDGSLAAASAGDGVVYVLDPATGVVKTTCLARSRQARTLAFSPDGKTLAGGGDDGSVQRWSAADGKLLGTTEAPVPQTSAPRAIRSTDNERAVAWGSRGAVTVVWEVPSGKFISPAGGHAAGLTAVAVAVGGKQIITAASDGVVLRWDATTGKELGAVGLRLPGSSLGSGLARSPVVLSADGGRAVATDGSGVPGVFDLPAGTQRFVIPFEPSRHGSWAFSADGAKLVQTATAIEWKKYPARVGVWDVATARKLGGAEVPGLSAVVASLSPDGKSLVTAGVRSDEKGTSKELVIAGWEVATGRKLGEYTEPSGFVTTAVVAAGDNRTALVRSATSGLMVVDFTTGTKVRDVALGDRRLSGSPAMAPDGKTAAVPLQAPLGRNPTTPVALVDVEAGKVTKVLEGLSGNLTCVAFSPDGRTLVAGSSDTTALVWDLAAP